MKISALAFAVFTLSRLANADSVSMLFLYDNSQCYDQPEAIIPVATMNVLCGKIPNQNTAVESIRVAGTTECVRLESTRTASELCAIYNGQ